MDFSSYVPIERCRLVRYDDYSETLDQSFETTEVGIFIVPHGTYYFM